jgi:hypothetical protein
MALSIVAHEYRSYAQRRIVVNEVVGSAGGNTEEKVVHSTQSRRFAGLIDSEDDLEAGSASLEI